MNRFLSRLSPNHKFLLSLLSIIIVGLALIRYTTDLFTTLSISVVICIFLWVIRPIWYPKDYRRTVVSKLSLFLVFSSTISYGFWEPYIRAILDEFFISHFPSFQKTIEQHSISPALTLSSFLLGVFIINYFNSDNTAMGISQNDIDKDLPPLPFDERFQNVVNALCADLHTINIKTNWSESLFTPLEAEVEIRKGNQTQKKVTDLLSAIKHSQDRLLLVLGEPGAGKSVALRKLALELAKREFKITKKIPVYINLKEWQVKKKWTEENPPTVTQLNEFVLKNLKQRDINTSRFFEKYYSRLYENGLIYFIFDSFDEIPAVLNEKENSVLIGKLSEVFFKFLKGGQPKHSKGILASRIFRKPTQEFQTNTILEIRAFSEEKIINLFNKSSYNSRELIRTLFSTRPDLVSLAKNPFISTLIIEYLENNQKLPQNKSELFKSHIDRTFDYAGERIEKRSLTKSKVIEGCLILANEMFENNNFEVSISKIRKKYIGHDFEGIIDVLEFGRIGRIGMDNNNFSFVHRRFAEYFKVKNMIDSKEYFDLDSIPSDSQYRDVLVLYCEISSEDEGRKIANYCWNEIKNSSTSINSRFIHSLRFLIAAFQNRLICLSDFKFDLNNFIKKNIILDNDILSIKLITESIGLIEEKDQDELLVNAFSLENDWINVTAVKACRNLSELSPSLKKHLFSFFSRISTLEFLHKYSTHKFLLTLSSSFKRFYNLLLFKVANFLFFIIGIISIYFVKPELVVACLLITFAIMGSIVFVIFLMDGFSLEKYYGTLDAFKIFFTVIFYFLLLLWFLSIFTSIISGTEVQDNFLLQGSPIPVTILSVFFFLPYYRILVDKTFFPTKVNSFFGKMKGLDWKRGVIFSLIYVISIFTIIIILPALLSLYFEISEGDVAKYIAVPFATFFIIKYLRSYYLQNQEKKEFLNRFNSESCSRTLIFECWTNCKHKRTRRDLITYLEENVKSVTDEYPDPKFLNLDKNDEYNNLTRLARLEEKWREL